MGRKHTSLILVNTALGGGCTELIEGIVAKSGFEMRRGVWEAVVTEACQDFSLDRGAASMGAAVSITRFDLMASGFEGGERGED
jgi:hypothetical protein